MENPFESLRTEMVDIKDMLSLIIARLDRIESPDEGIIGDVEDCSNWLTSKTRPILTDMRSEVDENLQNMNRNRKNR